MLFDSRPTVAWPPTTVAWSCSDFFQNFANLVWNVKNFVWQSADGRVTSVDCHVTVQRQFLKFCISAETSKYNSLTVSRRSCDLRRLSRDRSATFFKIFLNCLKRRKKLFDSRPTVACDCRASVQRLFSKFCHFSWNIEKMLFESQRTVALPSGYFVSVDFSYGFHIRCLAYVSFVIILPDEQVSIRHILTT